MNSSQTRLTLILLLSPFLLWLGLLVIIPHIDMFFLSIREKVAPRTYETSLANYAEFFTEPFYWNTLARTAFMSILATVLTLIIAFPVAYYIAKMLRGKTKSILFLLCLLPFWVSELVRTFGWMILLRETGVISSSLQWLGLIDGPIEFLYNDVTVMMGLIYTSMLFMVVPLVSTLDSLDDSLIEAGYDLGGSKLSILKEIVIPHSMPGIISGCIVVFMLTLGNYLTPILLGGKSSMWFTGQIYTQFITRFNWELGAAFGFLLLIVSSTIVWLGLKLSGQTLASTVAKS
ncbi:spermidine/putrescine ABC transporter permease [Oleiphilus sp. HI0009]|nr:MULTISPECIES: ABC transporter permease [unclassified Oleiphilus]KZX82790.1 spermidine/putrescine ABC transporter permease [Oleiphilus sp. HI0009]KZY61441.1 spermidine/putrescine ABC transporter permease [Oleiphilus sp. HI0066]KZY76900.1 spermidine/putrescine ABC transporter permease [Oleiphilus sp. HI0067]KZZ59933.1 spermidine/putrescine ABC transporter permease [Oleiphilus sp. HI0125]